MNVSLPQMDDLLILPAFAAPCLSPTAYVVKYFGENVKIQSICTVQNQNEMMSPKRWLFIHRQQTMTNAGKS